MEIEFASVQLVKNTDEYPYKVYQIRGKKRILIDLSNNLKQSTEFYSEFQSLFPSLKFELVISQDTTLKGIR